MTDLYRKQEEMYRSPDEVLFIGIDPGKTGAMAVLDKNGELYELIDFDVNDVVDFLATRYDPMVAYLEHVHAMHGQGVVSTFSFGENFGWWQGVLASFGVPVTLIDPRAWQKKFCLQKTDKTDKPSLVFARKMFPTADLRLKKHHNRSDALLIARACWEDNRKKEPIFL